MKEQLTMALQELQIAKQGNATLDDVTQDWANKAILKDYSPVLQEDASLNGKLIIMTKNKIKGKFLIDQNLNIEKIEYNTSSLEFEYTTVSRVDNKVKINIVVTDRINGIKQIDYPEGNPLKVVDGTKEQISIDYDVELGKEYKFVITIGDGNKTEKIIKIDDYFYNVTKDLGESAVINNNATKAAYNKTYEATISTEGNYAITSLVVTMGGQTVTTTGGNEVDINTGKIKIEKVTGDINIKVTTKKLEITYAIGVNASGSANDTSSLGANTQYGGKTLYINIIATLEGNKCTVVLKADSTKTVPYAVTTNGSYIFTVDGTYNGKVINEDKEIIVNQYKAQGGFVQYDAGDWTEEEIEELKENKLYDIQETNNYLYKLDYNDGNNLTFGDFTYKGDFENKEKIDNNKMITSRNQSLSDKRGWKVFEGEEKNGKTYVKKLIHAGIPENFRQMVSGNVDGGVGYRADYIISGGRRNYKGIANVLPSGKEIIPRDWNMYKDKKLDKLEYIKDIHILDYDEFLYIRDKIKDFEILKVSEMYYLGWNSTSSFGWNSGRFYADVLPEYAGGGADYCYPDFRFNYYCPGKLGIRPIVEMNDGVYIASGSGTEEDPYILGKE